MFLQSSLPSTSDSVTKAASVLNISQGASNIDNKTCQNAPIVDDNKPTPSTPRRDKSIKARSVQQQLLSPSNATSPRKRKLLNIINTKEHIIKKQRLQIKRIQAQNRRLKRKLNKIEDILNNIQEKFCLKDEDTNILKNINLQAQELTSRMVTKKSGGKCKQKYSPALRTFALTLHYYSPKAYDYIRRTFDTCLPERRTLRKWYEKIGGEPGFTKESFEALKQKAKNTNYTIIAGLTIDEMAIRRRIEYDGEKLVGHVDIGTGVEGDHVLEAKEALAYYKVNDYIEDKNAWRQAGPAPQGNEKCSNITILELSCSLKSVIGGGTQFARFPAIGELDGAGVRAMLVNGRCQLGLVSFRLY
uniref:SFRICE_033363 n=1 Tax=Spodoptera frugiperda TaxID=7108 RepID=A0A2H1WR26_SPOFR